MKKIYSILAAIIGEVIIVCVLFEFYGYLGERIFFQNLLFLTLAYGIFWASLFKPLAETESKEQKWVGMLGLHLFGTILLLSGTFLTILFCNMMTPPMDADHQLYILLALLAIFFLSRYFAFMSYEKVAKVYEKEKSMTNVLDVMKKTMDDLLYQLLQNQSVDPMIKERVNKIKDSLRYLSPVGTDEAFRLENEMKETIVSIQMQISNYTMNKSSVDQMVLKLEGLLQRRKNCFI
jgi:uncharacterized membrane protein SirB2